MARMVKVFMGLLLVLYLCISAVGENSNRLHTVVTLPKAMKGDRLFVKLQWNKSTTSTSTALMPSGAGLVSLISMASNLRAAVSSCQHVLSFTTDKHTNNIVRDVIEAGKGIEFIQIKRKECQLRGSVESSTTSNCCLGCKDVYIEALLSFIGYLNCKKVAIITTKEPFNVALSIIMYNSLRNSMLFSEEERIVTRFEFDNGDPVSVDEISLALSDLNSFGAGLIIVLANDATVDILLKMAGRYNILNMDAIWFLVEFNEKKIITKMPKKVVNMYVEEGGISNWNKMEVLTMINCVSRMQYNGTIKNERVHSTIKCDDSLEVHFASISQKRGNSIREWIVLSKWKQASGLEVSPTEERWLKLLSTPTGKTLLRVVCLSDKPFTSIAKHYETNDAHRPCQKGLECEVAKVEGDSTDWSKTCCIGHSIDLLQLLAKDLNFVPQIYLVKDGFYGSKVNGTWNGIVGELTKNKADLAATQLTITTRRSNVVEFTVPYSRVRQGILMLKKIEKQNIELQVLSFLDSNLLWVFLAVLLSGFLFIYSYEYISMKYQKKLRAIRGHQRRLWMETFTYVSGITFQRDLGGRNPKGVAARLSAIVVAFGMVIAMTAYTAVLTATKVVKEQKQPFNGIHDERLINPTPDFKFATVNSTSMETFFQESQNPSIGRMHQFMKKYNIKDTKEGVKQILRGELQGLINEWDVLQYHVNKQRDCSLHISDLQIAEMMHGFAVPKGSKLKEMISRRFVKYITDDVIVKINKKWLGGSCHDSKTKGRRNERYRIGNFVGLFLGILGTIAILVLVSAMLHVFRKFRLTRLKRTVKRPMFNSNFFGIVLDSKTESKSINFRC